MLARGRTTHDSGGLLSWPRPVADRPERRESGSSLHPATFQHQAAELATRLATVPSSHLDLAIVEGLRDLADTLRLDAAILCQTAGQPQELSHGWIAPPLSTLPELARLAAAPVVRSKLDTGAIASYTTLDEIPACDEREACRGIGLKSVALVPIALADGYSVGTALAVGSMTTEQPWSTLVIGHLRLVSSVLSQALVRKSGLTALERAMDELHQLREDARDDDAQAPPAVKVFRTSRLIVSDSPAVQHALAQVEQVARMPSTVLLLGETGVGKEVFAQAIHELSARQQRQMVRVSCAAIPAALIESELFGRERGAYTGALSRQIGRFEAANQSTLFLDEIGDLPAEIQVKLLRVLQERVIERLGSTQPIKVDVRIIAATNRNLEKGVEDRTFREDLFYRLNVFPIVVPPLRERVEDIPGLIWEFIHEFSQSLGKPIESISKESMRQLQLYSWPGNVRELRNVIERAVILATSPRLTVPIPQTPASRLPQSSMTLRELEIEHIRATLETTNWRIRGHRGAAERLGLKPTTLETRMAKLGLQRPKA